MSKGPWPVKPAPIKKLLRTLEEAGYRVTGVRVDHEGISVTTAPPNVDGKSVDGAEELVL
jgi:hypothetical protein